MNDLFRTIVKKVLLLASGLLAGAVISILPVALIHHRHISAYFQNLNWTNMLFFAICLITGSIVCLNISCIPKNFRWALGFFYLFCYTACAALCQKIALTPMYIEPFGQISSNLSETPIVITFSGLILISLATLLQIKTVLQGGAGIQQVLPSSPDRIVSKHPFHESWLLFMCGVPFLFGVWLPLIALPGAWIFLKWLIK